jgi:hypothetical protein
MYTTKQISNIIPDMSDFITEETLKKYQDLKCEFDVVFALLVEYKSFEKAENEYEPTFPFSERAKALLVDISAGKVSLSDYRSDFELLLFEADTDFPSDELFSPMLIELLCGFIEKTRTDVSLFSTWFDAKLEQGN